MVASGAAPRLSAELATCAMERGCTTKKTHAQSTVFHILLFSLCAASTLRCPSCLEVHLDCQRRVHSGLFYTQEFALCASAARPHTRGLKLYGEPPKPVA